MFCERRIVLMSYELALNIIWHKCSCSDHVIRLGSFKVLEFLNRKKIEHVALRICVFLCYTYLSQQMMFHLWSNIPRVPYDMEYALMWGLMHLCNAYIHYICWNNVIFHGNGAGRCGLWNWNCSSKRKESRNCSVMMISTLQCNHVSSVRKCEWLGLL